VRHLLDQAERQAELGRDSREGFRKGQDGKGRPWKPKDNERPPTEAEYVCRLRKSIDARRKSAGGSPKLAADERELASHIQVATQWDQLAKPMAEVEAAKEAAKTVKES
jgi:hypothetical protein